MSLTAIAELLAFTLTLLLFIQGISIIRLSTLRIPTPDAEPSLPSQLSQQKKILRPFGLLTVLLAILNLGGLVLILTGGLVHSSEYAVLIVQGALNRNVLMLLITGSAIGAGLGRYMARLAAGWSDSLVFSLAAGVVAGLLSAFPLLRPITPGEPVAFQLYTYDLLWPPMLVWLSFCLIEILATIFNMNTIPLRGFGLGFLLLVLAFLAIRHPVLEYSLTRNTWILILFLSIILLLFPIIRRQIFSPGSPIQDLRKGTDLIQAPRQAFILFSRNWKDLLPERDKTLIVFALLLLAAGVVILLFNVANLGPLVAILILIVGWIWLSEIISNAWIDLVARHLLPLLAPDSPGRKRLERMATKVSETGTSLGKWLSGLGSLPTTGVAIVKLLLAIAILIAFNEALHNGQTIIRPFKGVGYEDPDGLTATVSDRVLNNLSLLNRELQPEVIVPGARETGRTSYIRTTGNVSSIDAVIQSGDAIEFNTFKIPPSLLVGPIQEPIRMLFGIRTIDGSIFYEGKIYTLLAHLNNGESWMAVSKSDDLAASIVSLSEELAFQIIIASPALESYGMTRSWLAFQDFRNGLKEMQDFERSQDYDALTRAIEAFRSSLKKDKGFALAYYRLGLALQSDGQPAAATEAFRTGLSLRPDFTALQIALAYHLYYFDGYYFPTAAPLPVIMPSSPEVQQSRQESARRLWQQVISIPADQVSLPDRASAYYGLCIIALDRASNAENPDMRRIETDQGYYFCGRAKRLYASLPAELIADPRIRSVQAYLLNAMGVLIDLRAGKTVSLKDASRDGTPWDCSPAYNFSNGEPEPVNYYSHRVYSWSAVDYYSRALQLAPADPVIQCNHAIGRFLIDSKSKSLETLRDDPAYRLYRANTYLSKAKQDQFEAEFGLTSPFFQAALDEYQAAINLDPLNLEALNGYAYTYWVWRLHHPGADPAEAFSGFKVKERAEENARTAVRLASEKQESLYTTLYADTLAALLLGDSHPSDAIEEMKPLLDKQFLPDHFSYDEIRWNYAQALLCAASYYSRPGLASNLVVASYKEEIEEIESFLVKAESFLAQAKDYLKQIEENEKGREFQPFTSHPELLSPFNRLPLCDPPAAEYILQPLEIDHARQPVCEVRYFWWAVTNSDGAINTDLSLKVWAKNSSLASISPYSYSPPLPPGRDHFFVQILGPEGEPLSGVYPVPAKVSPIDGACPHDVDLALWFKFQDKQAISEIKKSEE